MTWYVDPKTGSDANNGKSAETAFRTLWHAVERAAAGDTVLMAPGPYDEDLPGLVGRARAARVTIDVVGGR
jgi:uncharacterized protein DUF1565